MSDELNDLILALRELAKKTYGDPAELINKSADMLEGFQQEQQCKGMNCGCTDGVNHSLECQAEHAAAITGGKGGKQQAELRAALWHVKNTAISLADAQVIALEALAAHAKKEGV